MGHGQCWIVAKGGNDAVFPKRHFEKKTEKYCYFNKENSCTDWIYATREDCCWTVLPEFRKLEWLLCCHPCLRYLHANLHWKYGALQFGYKFCFGFYFSIYSFTSVPCTENHKGSILGIRSNSPILMHLETLWTEANKQLCGLVAVEHFIKGR